MKNYLSFGGGVNSVALHLMLLEQGIDFESVFVNHQTDWPETYQYVAGFQWWLKAQGHRPITILNPGSLMAKCEEKRWVPSMMRRWYTGDYKITPVNRYIKKPCWMYIGYSVDESHRAKTSSRKGIEYRWPLIENEIDREGCVDIIRQAGLPIPMKSGCYICPFQRREQWVALRRKHPCLFSSAVELEKSNMALRKERGKVPLALSMSKKTLPVIVGENQNFLFEEDNYPPCQCGL